MKIFLGFLLVSLLSTSTSHAMSKSYQKTIYNGCYPESKKYLGAVRAQQYCKCTIKMLSKKYTDKDMDSISQQNAKFQLKSFSFASKHCNNNINPL